MYYIFWVCVCSLRYSTWNAHASYCHLWPFRLYSIFPHLNHKRDDYRKNITEHKICASNFSTYTVWNIFHSKKNRARYDRKCILVHIKYPFYSCPILMKLKFAEQIFEKSLNIKFYENLSSGSRVVPCGRTDMTKLIVAFRDFAKSDYKLVLQCN
jgi:hypothetical protein